MAQHVWFKDAAWRQCEPVNTELGGNRRGVTLSRSKAQEQCVAGIACFSSKTQGRDTFTLAVVVPSELVSLFLFRCSLTHNFDRDRQLGFCLPKNTQPDGELTIKHLLYWNVADFFSLFFLILPSNWLCLCHHSFCPHVAQGQWCVSAQPLSERRSLCPGPLQLLHTVLLPSELHWQPLSAQWVHSLLPPSLSNHLLLHLTTWCPNIKYQDFFIYILAWQLSTNWPYISIVTSLTAWVDLQWAHHRGKYFHICGMFLETGRGCRF